MFVELLLREKNELDPENRTCDIPTPPMTERGDRGDLFLVELASVDDFSSDGEVIESAAPSVDNGGTSFARSSRTQIMSSESGAKKQLLA